MGALVAMAMLLASAGREPVPIFPGTTRLVHLTVTVLDREGDGVTDLRPEDFTVQEDGKPRPIELFTYDGAPPAQPTAPPPPAGVFTNRVELTAGPPRNITALVLDDLNTPPRFTVRVRGLIMRYLKALAPQTRVAVFRLGAELRVVHDFTDDGDSLRERIAKAALAVPLRTETDLDVSVAEAEEFVAMYPDMAAVLTEVMRGKIEEETMANAYGRRVRLEKTLASMESLGRHLAGMPGRFANEGADCPLRRLGMLRARRTSP